MFKSLTGMQIETSRPTLVLYAILAGGVALRTFHYLDNRSLWEDEVFLASSLIHMDFVDLATQPLEYQQRAPIGFLWLARFGVVLFNKREMALRLVPFLGGILALFLYVPVARHFLRSQAGLMASVFMVAFAPPIIYHSVEIKQYGIEFLATVLCLLLYARYQSRTDLRGLLAWGLGGALILWFSFSSLFVLSGMAAAIGLKHLIRKNWRVFFLNLIPFGMWLASFAAQYVIFLSRFPEEAWLVQFWRNRDAFMPFPPRSLADLLWPLNQVYSLIRYPLGLSWFDLDYMHGHADIIRILARMPLLPILAGLAGLYVLFRKEKWTLLLLAFPVLAALAASALELYPLRERLTLFLAPVFIIVIAKGVDALSLSNARAATKMWFTAALLAAPLFNSVWQAVDTNLFGDYKKSREREAILYAADQYRPGDVVYVYWNNLPSFQYYQEAYNLDFNVVYGSDVRLQSQNFTNYFENLSNDFSKIVGGNRLWYFYKPYNGIKIGDIENEPRWYYHDVDAVGKMFGQVAALGTLISVFPLQNVSTDVKVCLFNISTHAKTL